MKYIYKLMIENYARCTYLLKSPRSGKFVSDVPNWCENRLKIEANTFQSPKSGKFVSDLGDTISLERYNAQKFQSPKSGKFVSDRGLGLGYPKRTWTSFNPLDLGNLYRMTIPYIAKTNARALLCFNPLNRGNLYLIWINGSEISTNQEVSIP